MEFFPLTYIYIYIYDLYILLKVKERDKDNIFLNIIFYDLQLYYTYSHLIYKKFIIIYNIYI